MGMGARGQIRGEKLGGNKSSRNLPEAGRDSSASFQNNDCGVPELASGQGVGKLKAESLR